MTDSKLRQTPSRTQAIAEFIVHLRMNLGEGDVSVWRLRKLGLSLSEVRDLENSGILTRVDSHYGIRYRVTSGAN